MKFSHLEVSSATLPILLAIIGLAVTTAACAETPTPAGNAGAVVQDTLPGASNTVRAATYHVGANRDYKTLKDVLPNLKAGDIVEVDPGVYHETDRIAAVGARNAPIVIRGAGTGADRPIFDADGIDTSGEHATPRGVFEITGSYIVIQHLEFRNARNHQNAAGIRMLDSTNAVIRDCKVNYNDMGIFGGDKETVIIEDSEIFNNGTKDFNGGSHNFYMHGNRVVVRNCYIHDSLFGQNYKSRAHYNELWFNWITDSEEGEVGCVDEPNATELPNSNVLMVGNVVISRADRTGNHAKYILYGSELGGKHVGTLYLFRNTFIANDPHIQFVNLSDPNAQAVIEDNVFQGSDNLLILPQPALSITAIHNLVPKTAHIPNGWTNRRAGPLRYTDGDGVVHTLDLEPADEGSVHLNGMPPVAFRR